VQYQRIEPAPSRRRPGASGRSKSACSPAHGPTAIESSRRATYHSYMTTGSAAATRYLLPGAYCFADTVNNRA
jgi:hypothetical protein